MLVHVEVERNTRSVVENKVMLILRFINDDDDLSVKEFVSLADLKEYINQKNLEKTWHQIEEVKKVIPNLKED